MKGLAIAVILLALGVATATDIPTALAHPTSSVIAGVAADTTTDEINDIVDEVQTRAAAEALGYAFPKSAFEEQPVLKAKDMPENADHTAGTWQSKRRQNIQQLQKVAKSATAFIELGEEPEADEDVTADDLAAVSEAEESLKDESDFDAVPLTTDTPSESSANVKHKHRFHAPSVKEVLEDVDKLSDQDLDKLISSAGLDLAAIDSDAKKSSDAADKDSSVDAAVKSVAEDPKSKAKAASMKNSPVVSALNDQDSKKEHEKVDDELQKLDKLMDQAENMVKPTKEQAKTAEASSAKKETPEPKAVESKATQMRAAAITPLAPVEKFEIFGDDVTEPEMRSGSNQDKSAEQKPQLKAVELKADHTLVVPQGFEVLGDDQILGDGSSAESAITTAVEAPKATPEAPKAAPKASKSDAVTSPKALETLEDLLDGPSEPQKVADKIESAPAVDKVETALAATVSAQKFEVLGDDLDSVDTLNAKTSAPAQAAEQKPSRTEKFEVLGDDSDDSSAAIAPVKLTASLSKSAAASDEKFEILGDDLAPAEASKSVPKSAEQKSETKFEILGDDEPSGVVAASSSSTASAAASSVSKSKETAQEKFEVLGDDAAEAVSAPKLSSSLSKSVQKKSKEEKFEIFGDDEEVDDLLDGPATSEQSAQKKAAPTAERKEQSNAKASEQQKFEILGDDADSAASTDPLASLTDPLSPKASSSVKQLLAKQSSESATAGDNDFADGLLTRADVLASNNMKLVDTKAELPNNKPVNSPRLGQLVTDGKLDAADINNFNITANGDPVLTLHTNPTDVENGQKGTTMMGYNKAASNRAKGISVFSRVSAADLMGQNNSTKKPAYILRTDKYGSNPRGCGSGPGVANCSSKGFTSKPVIQDPEHVIPGITRANPLPIAPDPSSLTIPKPLLTPVYEDAEERKRLLADFTVPPVGYTVTTDHMVQFGSQLPPPIPGAIPVSADGKPLSTPTKHIPLPLPHDKGHVQWRSGNGETILSPSSGVIPLFKAGETVLTKN